MRVCDDLPVEGRREVGAEAQGIHADSHLEDEHPQEHELGID